MRALGIAGARECVHEGLFLFRCVIAQRPSQGGVDVHARWVGQDQDIGNTLIPEQPVQMNALVRSQRVSELLQVQDGPAVREEHPVEAEVLPRAIDNWKVSQQHWVMAQFIAHGFERVHEQHSRRGIAVGGYKRAPF